MDLLTLLGLAFGGGAVYYVMKSGGIEHLLINYHAGILVFGGTFSAILIGHPWQLVKKIPKVVTMVIFPQKTYEPQQVIPRLVWLAEKSKRSGISSLTEEIPNIKDNFLRDGIQMLIDRVDPEVLRDNLEKEIVFTRERHTEISNVFRTMGTLAPVFGLLGTLIGVIQVLKNLTDPQSIGASMAIAITTTLYGIFSTNFIFLPIATKLRNLSEREIFVKRVMIEGILSIQQGDIPTVVKQKLDAFLGYKMRKIKS